MSSKNKHNADKDKWQKFAEQEQAREEVERDDDAADLDTHSAEGLTYPSHEALEQQLNALEAQLADYKDAAMRAKAEADNVRRRADLSVQKAHQFGNEKLLRDLLPVLDSLLRGLQAPLPDDPQAQSYREGMVLTLDLLEKTLEKHGVTSINPTPGEPFNPEQHEAMSMQPVADMASNNIVQVLQKGYELNGRVIRAAMVIVAA